jgi:ABC-type multidrug transport system permease subunit
LTSPSAVRDGVLWRGWVAGRHGWAEFGAQNPWRIQLTTALPRAVLQSIFLTMVGRVVGGPAGAEFALVGSLASVLALNAAVAIADVPMVDKWSGTFYRICSGVLPPFAVFALRAAPYPITGFAGAVLALVIAGPVTGHAALLPRLLPWLPLFAVMAFTTAATGLAAAGLAVGRRADVVAGNLLSYLILLAGGVFLPAGRVAWVDALGSVLPVRHGLAAVHAGLAGRPWLPDLLAEVTVGAGWLLVAWLIVVVQVRRARASGHDDFA